MTVPLSESHIKLINAIARQNGFTDNFEVDTLPGSVNGAQIRTVLKSASSSEAFRKVVPIRKIYCREQDVYKKLFVEFKEFQDEFNISNPFTGHPKLFGTSSEDGQECLVMENLLATGYKLWNRRIPMDAKHIKAVFIEYAKFHSISLALAHKKPELFNDLTKDIQEHPFQKNLDSPEELDIYVKSSMANGFKALEDVPKILDVLTKFADSIPEYFSKEINNSKWNLVVNHGDCWCNNLMFRYDDPVTKRKISKVCILDWQLAKTGSPAADLTSFFLAHSPKEVLYDYKSYLKVYHDTVCKNLRDFSIDPEEIFPYTLLEQHWRKFINFGIFIII